VRGSAVRHRASRWIAAVALTALGAACSVPFGLRPERLPRGKSDTSITQTALDRARSLYLYPERFNRRILIGALDALEQTFDPVRFEEDIIPGEEAGWGTLWVADVGARVPIPRSPDPEEFAQILSQVVAFIEERLPQEVNRDDETNVELIALQGAMNELDRYSTVFSERGTADFEIRFEGQLSGIGTTVSREEGALKAIEVFPGGPASRAGLQDGDVIERIDQASTHTLSLRDAVDKLRGPTGTRVVLAVLRTNEESKQQRNLELTVTRGQVKVPSVITKDLGDGIGYAQIRTVSQGTPDEFRVKVRDLGDIKGLVIDLRGNAGGVMLAATALADYFVADDLLLRVVDRSGNRSELSSRYASPDVLFEFPVVVLVDENTASAAEILAGAIEPLERVTLIGQRTFGKGLFQRVMPLPHDHMLKLTVGEYLLSGDRAINEKGLEPDIALHPVSKKSLGRLAQRPTQSLAYLVEPDAKEDPHPKEIAKAVLLEGRQAAITRLGASWDTEIAGQLKEYGVRWSGIGAIRADELQVKMRVEGGPLVVLDGTPTRIALKITNPNTFDVPNVWASLSGPVEYLDNKLVPLGTIPAGGSVSNSIDIDPVDGLATSPLPLFVNLTSGPHFLQRERLKMPVAAHPPDLRIDVERTGPESVKVVLTNRGCCDTGPLLVSVPGTPRPLESLGAGESQTVDLPLTGDAENISVRVSGSGVIQRIDMPVPEQHLTVIPPALRMTRRTFLGRRQIRVETNSNEGLREGWIALDGQKQSYVAWGGASDGTLRAELARPSKSRDKEPTGPERIPGGDQMIAESSGDISVRTKVETLSGVSLIDVRTLIAE